MSPWWSLCIPCIYRMPGGVIVGVGAHCRKKRYIAAKHCNTLPVKKKLHCRKLKCTLPQVQGIDRTDGYHCMFRRRFGSLLLWASVQCVTSIIRAQLLSHCLLMLQQRSRSHSVSDFRLRPTRNYINTADSVGKRVSTTFSETERQYKKEKALKTHFRDL